MASLSESVNSSIQRCLLETPYTSVATSWNDVLRTMDSTHGPNITDVRVRTKSDKTVFVVRPENFNEMVVDMSSSDISVMTCMTPPSTSIAACATNLRLSPPPITPLWRSF